MNLTDFLHKPRVPYINTNEFICCLFIDRFFEDIMRGGGGVSLPATHF